jgi:tight adherence protein C
MSSRRRAAAVADALPDLVDLFAIAAASGLNPRLAVDAVAERSPPGPLTDAFLRASGRVATTGARLADALDRIPDELGEGGAGDVVRPLVRALTDAERYGAALGPSLDRLAEDARRARQRRAEEAARRVPVRLLFPLVTCILPAFGLLTVAPLLAGGLRALRL